MVGTWFGNRHAMDNDTLGSRLSLHAKAHKEVMRGPKDPPNRWRKDGRISLKMVTKKCHPSLELAGTLEIWKGL